MTVDAVPVRGRDTAINIKSRVDGATESSEYIMPGLHVYHCSNSILHTGFPTMALLRTLHLRPGLPSGPMPDWASGNFFFLVVFFVVHVNFQQTSMTLNNFNFLLCSFIIGETKNTVFTMCRMSARRIIQPKSYPVTRE